ncbi:hypothetical protein [uncultured Winogradskyella sp.]|uniref:hypothetical protein n=1 Tax=uncultured Winogradskyella sp. TaxID=395353 RepID=UPI0030EDD266|tara:strand:+ start:618 stop:1220 length:603 start_codon:yes stop_codon:yes gene_type:complete
MKNYILPILLLTSILSFAQNNSENKDFNKNEGYFNITKIGYIKVNELRQEVHIPGEGTFFSEPDTDNSHAWSLQTINGYFISPYFSLGIAVGLDGYHNPNFNTLPVLLDIRTYLTDEEDSFYAFLDIGPSLRIGGENSELRKGMVFNIGAGYKFKVAENLFLISDISYSHKTISLTDEWIGTSDSTIKANGVGLNLGIIF